MVQFIISALGSYGDVHPMVGLGMALAARGHDVKIITNPYFEDVVTGAGLKLLPLGTREEYIELTQHPDLWHPIRGPKLVLSYMGGAGVRPLFELAMQSHVPCDTVYCAHTLDLGGRVAAEMRDIPVASVVLAPSTMWTIHDSPRLKGALLGPGVPKWLKRFQFWMSDTMFVLPLMGELNELRRELRLPPVKRLFGRWLHDTDMILCLFPDWFGMLQPDWPSNTRTVGFPLWDAHDEVPDSPEARQFLAAGSPPIAFSPGSANREAHQFFEAAVDACQRLGRRGILLTKYDHQLPANLPGTIRHFGFLPLSRLLPHMAALVHHGGIGTCAQGLAAGVPQLVRPMSFDQFDNSRRLMRLGVSEEISVQRFRGRTAAESLKRLLDSPDVAENCREYAKRCDGPAARTTACEALEQLANIGVELQKR
jgi:rhamnosyltransferase subunit B